MLCGIKYSIKKAKASQLSIQLVNELIDAYPDGSRATKFLKMCFEIILKIKLTDDHIRGTLTIIRSRYENPDKINDESNDVKFFIFTSSCASLNV